MLPLERTHCHYNEVPTVPLGYLSYIRYWGGSSVAKHLSWAGLKGVGMIVLQNQFVKAQEKKIRIGLRIIRNGPDAGNTIPAGEPYEIATHTNGRDYRIWAPLTEQHWKSWEMDLEQIRDDLPYLPYCVDFAYPYGILDEPNMEWAIGEWGLQKCIDDTIRDLEIQFRIWGKRLVINLGGRNDFKEAVLKRAAELGIIAFRQDNFGEETIPSMYEDALTWLGAVWHTEDGIRQLESTPMKLGIAEVSYSGIDISPSSHQPEPHDWDWANIDRERMIGEYGEFWAAGFTVLADMGRMNVPLSNNARQLIADEWHRDYEEANNWTPPWEEQPPVDPKFYNFPVEIKGGTLDRVVFGGPYPDIVFAPDTRDALIPIPIANGERWDPRVHIRALPQKWTITPAEPKDLDKAYSFHCKGRNGAFIQVGDVVIPQPPTLEQRVNRLELLTVKQQQQINSLNANVAAHEKQIGQLEGAVRRIHHATDPLHDTLQAGGGTEGD